MTIGIAAHGPGAGHAILLSLRCVEALATGAIGGFVSVAAFDETGAVHRIETQDGGVTGLFSEERIPFAILEARSAVLMSSGPNRPLPLSQFTPAASGIGLVTGHRFPNNPSGDGRSLSEMVLSAMAAGATPHEAVEAVVAANPGADAGLIALSPDGDLFAADTAFIDKFGDRGRALRQRRDGEAQVAILHNGIEPSENLGPLLAEMIIKAMTPISAVAGILELCAGMPVIFGEPPGIAVSDTGEIDRVAVAGTGDAKSPWSCGIGYRAPVWRCSQQIGVCLDEPFLVTRDRKIVSVNGRSSGVIRWSASAGG